MYAKIFAQIYEGSLCSQGPWQALVTFQQMLVLADKEGVVDMTADAISRRTTIPLEIIEAGLAVLTQPDPFSRTPAEEGRRLLPLSPDRPWGWLVVNYTHYRKMKREEDRKAYHREYWHKRKLNRKLNNSTTTQPNQPIAYAVSICSKERKDMATCVAPPLPEDEKKALTEKEAGKSKAIPFAEIVALYHELLPELPRVEKLTEARRGYLRQRWAEDLPDLEHWKNYFTFVRESAFLMGRTSAVNGRTPFRANLEWLVRPSNYANIAEEKYHG